MADIHLLRQGHPLWENTASFARDCSWRAGPVLAERMRINAFQSWERVIAAEEGGSVIGFCTFTEKERPGGGAPFYALCAGNHFSTLSRKRNRRSIFSFVMYAGSPWRAPGKTSSSARPSPQTVLMRSTSSREAL